MGNNQCPARQTSRIRRVECSHVDTLLRLFSTSSDEVSQSDMSIINFSSSRIGVSRGYGGHVR